MQQLACCILAQAGRQCCVVIVCFIDSLLQVPELQAAMTAALGLAVMLPPSEPPCLCSLSCGLHSVGTQIGNSIDASLLFRYVDKEHAAIQDLLRRRGLRNCRRQPLQPASMRSQRAAIPLCWQQSMPPSSLTWDLQLPLTMFEQRACS